MPNPATAVVVVSYNTRELLLSCLASVASAVAAARASEVAVVVVDNASSDGSLAAVQSAYPAGGEDLRVDAIANPTNRGFAAACNQAIRATTAPFVLLLNSDAALDASALDALWRCMEAHPHCAAAGCAVRRPDGSAQTTARRDLTPLNQAAELLLGPVRLLGGRLARTARLRPGPDGVDETVDWLEGSCLLLRRSALDEVGLFDERFFMYGEDEDLCRRLRRAGHTVAFTSAGAATHVGGASASREPDAMRREHALSQMKLLVKYDGPAAVRRFARAMQLALWLKEMARRSDSVRRPPSAEDLARARRALRAAYASRAWEAAAGPPASAPSASSSAR